jgi:thiamine kinase-like enzyme
MIYSATGQTERAFQWLHKAYNDHEVEMYWLKVEPLFKPLHNDPRFQNLLKKIGFPD